MKKQHLTFAFFLFATCLLFGADGDRIAFLKGDHVFVADADGKNAKQIDRDQRRKSNLCWDAANQRLGFLTDRTGGELARFVSMSPTGKVTADVPIRPATDPPTAGMRYVEDLECLPNGRIRVAGRLNTSWNCEQLDQDPATGKTYNDVFGKCGSFALSPDGKHMAKLGTVPPTDDEHRFDTVLVDESPGPASANYPNDLATVSYWGGSDSDAEGIFVLGGPSWSPDSRQIAVIERRSSDQQLAVVILTPADGPGEKSKPRGRVQRIWIPDQPLEGLCLEWVGRQVVVGQGDYAVSVDSLDPHAPSVAATFDLKVELARRKKVRNDAAAAAAKAAAIFRQFGGSEGVPLTQKGATQ